MPLDVRSACDAFDKFLRNRGMRCTDQRRAVVESFLTYGGHLTVDEIFDRLHPGNPAIGRSTVYRTMKLLAESGLAQAIDLEDGFIRYEVPDGHHHDHLVCVHCGKTVEVADEELERIQDRLVRAAGFLPTGHRLVLFGVCADCRKKAPIIG